MAMLGKEEKEAKKQREVTEKLEVIAETQARTKVRQAAEEAGGSYPG
jgi:hypothetical protein